MASIHAPNLGTTKFPEICTPHVNQVQMRTNTSGNIWNQADRTQQPHTQEAAARAFVLPSATHGFRYMYLPVRARIPTVQMRARLRKIGINNSRILDTHYPDHQVIALLMHNDFVPDFLRALDKFGIKPLDDFDLWGHSNLRDPKYASEHHNLRMLRVLNFIRSPVRYEVARQFATLGWIMIVQLRDILAARPRKLPTTRNRSDHTAANIFHRNKTE
ncbi:hypothetical protein DFQ28_007142, partial [Apophysomyces sp. BC1034]